MNSSENWSDLLIRVTIASQDSDFYFIGKTSVITKFRKSCLQNVAAIFLRNNATREEIEKAGVEMFQKR